MPATMTFAIVRKDLTPRAAEAVDIRGEKVCVINAGGDYFAIAEECSYDQGPLHEGPLYGGMVTCPRCSSIFYIRTGQVKKWPATEPIKAYTVEYDADSVYVGEAKPTYSVGKKFMAYDRAPEVSKETEIKW